VSNIDKVDEDAMPDMFPQDGFTLLGMSLDHRCIMSASLIRNRKEGTLLDVNYAITKDNVDMLTADLDNFTTDEAYLTLYDDDERPRSVITLTDLQLDHLELVTDEDSDEEPMYAILSYRVGSISQQKK
jgi:hypothetical protein